MPRRFENAQFQSADAQRVAFAHLDIHLAALQTIIFGIIARAFGEFQTHRSFIRAANPIRRFGRGNHLRVKRRA